MGAAVCVAHTPLRATGVLVPGRGWDPLAAAIVFGGLDVLVFGWVLRAARHPRLDRVQRRPWRFLAAGLVPLGAGSALYGRCSTASRWPMPA